jgi:tripartite-type tricarboxylate transporter receptor subunit TctC
VRTRRVEALAQAWPSKTIRYIVPFPPGAFNDTLGRTIATDLSKALGQPVVVDNRPGGNSIIGTEAAAKSAPDGYTLFGAALPFSVIQSLYKTSFDVTRILPASRLQVFRRTCWWHTRRFRRTPSRS